MPTFEFTSPDGKTYEINGPEGATEAQAFQILQKQLGSTAPSTSAAPTATAPKKESGVLDTLKGVGEAALGAGTGIAGGLIGSLAGVGSTLTSGKYGTQEGIREGEKRGSEIAQSLTYTPRGEKGKEYLSNLGEAAQGLGLEALPGLATETNVIGNAARAAKPLAAVRGAQALEKGSELAQRGSRAIPAALPEVPAAVRNAPAAVRNAIPKALGFDKEKLTLAQKAKDLGITIRPDQISDNKILKMMGEALDKVPLSGSKTEANQIKFNQALIKEIGGDPNAKKLTPEVFGNAIRDAGKRIGEIGEKQGVKLDNKTQIKLNDFLEDAKNFETNDVAKVARSYLKEIQSKNREGLMDGTAFRKLNSKLSKQIQNTSNGDLKNKLGELQEILHDAVAKSIGKEDKKAWDTARMQYAKAKTLEPLVAKTLTGDISAPSLMGAVTANKSGKAALAQGRGGSMADLARIGQLLKEPSSSGTAERGLAYGILGGGALANPAATGGVYGAANLYNRLGPYLIPNVPQVP